MLVQIDISNKLIICIYRVLDHEDIVKETVSDEIKEESDHDKEDHATDTDEHVNVQIQEIDEGDSEGEGDFPQEDEDGGEEINEEKTLKPKATSDSDEEVQIITKDESTTNTNSSAKQRSVPKKLMNQFNFFERCALTEEIILRVI